MQVTTTQCNDQVSAPTRIRSSQLRRFHPLPERDFAVFYDDRAVRRQPDNFTVSSGQARVWGTSSWRVRRESWLTARVTGISPVAGPSPYRGPGAKTEDLSPQPIG